MKFKYVCKDCGREYESDEVMYLCPHCSEHQEANTFEKGVLLVELDETYLKSLKKKDKVSAEDFFVYPILDASSFPVGPTPLVRPRRIEEKYGFTNLAFKLDSQLLSGSFKDRASQFVAAQAVAKGCGKIALASTGNAGAAMSAVGAAYGLEIVLFVPESAPVGKLMQSVLYGATVVPVKGTYDDAFRLSIEYTKHFGGINRNTAYNPMTIEGKKSVSIELFEQLERRLPDVIYVPTGDGCILGGVWKGFHDLLRAGLIEKMPRLVASQSKASNAISQAFKTGFFSPVKATTRADSISVSCPANGRMAVRAIRESEGWTTEVEDEEILSAQLELAKEAGLFVEPAAACAFAAFKADEKFLREQFGEEASILVLLTGTGFKDMAVFEGRVKLPEAIENSEEAVIKRFSFQ